MIKALILGDPTGFSDEGMKNIARNLTRELADIDDVDAQFVSPQTVLKNPQSFEGYKIFHYMSIIILTILKKIFHINLKVNQNKTQFLMKKFMKFFPRKILN